MNSTIKNPSTIKWYYTKKDLFEKHPDALIYIARDSPNKNKGEKQFACFNSNEDLEKCILSIKESDRHFYEILKHDRPMRMYVDFETDPKKNEPPLSALEKDSLVQRTITLLLSSVTCVSDPNVVVLDSSGVNKTSLHFIPHYYFNNFDDLLTYEHSIDDELKELGMDIGVYDHDRLMRTALSCKKKDPERVLRIATYHPFQKTLITNTEGCVLAEFNTDKAPTTKTQKGKSTIVLSTTECDGLNSFILKNVNVLSKFTRDYGDWIKIGIKLKDAGLSFNTWSEISKVHSDIYDHDLALKKWDSFKVSGNNSKPLLTFFKYNGVSVQDIFTDTFNKYTPDHTYERRLCYNLKHKLEYHPFIALKSSYMTGKTQCAMLPFLKQCVQDKTSLVYISEKRALSRSFSGIANIKNYMDSTGDIDSPYISVQLDSLHRIKRTYDVVVLDEVRSLIKCFKNPTLTKKLNYVYLRFKRLIENAKYIIMLDADLTDHICDLFEKHFGVKVYKIENTYKPLTDRHIRKMYYSYGTNDPRAEYLNDLLAELESGKNIVCPVMSKGFGGSTFSNIVSHIKTEPTLFGKKVLMVNGDGAFQHGILEEEVDQHEFKKQVLNDLDKYALQCNLFIYSPTITSGVSFEHEHFHKVYGALSLDASTYISYTQQIFRVRNLIDKEYNFILSKNMHYCTSITEPSPLLEDVKNSVKRRYNILSHDDTFLQNCVTGIDNQELYTYEENFLFDSYCFTLKEEHDSYDFIPRFLDLMKGFGIEIKEYEELPVVDMKNEKERSEILNQENKEAQEANKKYLEDLYNCEDVPLEEYERLAKKKEGLTPEDQIKKMKYYLKYILLDGLPFNKDICDYFYTAYVFGINSNFIEIKRTVENKEHLEEFMEHEDDRNIQFMNSEEYTMYNIDKCARAKKRKMCHLMLNMIGFRDILDDKVITKTEFETRFNEHAEVLAKDHWVMLDVFNLRKSMNKEVPSVEWSLKKKLAYVNKVLNGFHFMEVGLVGKGQKQRNFVHILKKYPHPEDLKNFDIVRWIPYL